ncbi:TetR family transcriptional regulator [Prescottella equi]|nr:TetR family transcriptional regulator [Prescottella equi]UNQ35816.1 TetR family transcriptional regulator [Prescottella equi]
MIGGAHGANGRLAGRWEPAGGCGRTDHCGRDGPVPRARIRSGRVLDVAERAGCSRATLYRYVGGKPAIVAAVVSSAAASVAEDVACAVAHLDGADRVVEAILTSVAAVRADPALSYWFAQPDRGGERLPRVVPGSGSVRDDAHRCRGRRPGG